MHNRRRGLRHAAWAAAIVLGLVGVATPALAVPREVSEEAVHFSIAYLDRSISFDNALKLSASSDLDVVGYRYENDKFVGEFFPRERDAQDVYKGIVAQYGADPHVTAFITESIVPIEELEEARKNDSVTTIEVPAEIPSYVSPEHEGGSFWEDIVDQRSEERGDASTRGVLSNTWEPTFLEIGTTDIPSNRSLLYSRYSWDISMGHHPIWIEEDWGAEFELIQYNDSALWTGQTRPACFGGPGFVNQHFWANNQGFDWTVLAPFGSATAAQAYGDYNDLFDPCAQQSISVGLGEPWQILDNGFLYTEVYIIVDAAGGTLAADSPVSGTIDLNETFSCDPPPWNGVAHTDCVGLSETEYWGDDPDYYLTANRSRGYEAPGDCWSLTFGDPNGPFEFNCDVIFG